MSKDLSIWRSKRIFTIFFKFFNILLTFDLKQKYFYKKKSCALSLVRQSWAALAILSVDGLLSILRFTIEYTHDESLAGRALCCNVQVLVPSDNASEAGPPLERYVTHIKRLSSGRLLWARLPCDRNMRSWVSLKLKI